MGFFEQRHVRQRPGTARAVILVSALGALIIGFTDVGAAGQRDRAGTSSRTQPGPAAAAVQRYIEAVAAGDRVAAGRLDFACQYRMRGATKGQRPQYPPDSDPLYGSCWQQIESAHASAIERQDQGMNAIWPGKGSLVFFTEDLTHYPPSTFVMDHLGTSPPAGGLKAEVVDTKALPPASFPGRSGEAVVAAPATTVTMRIRYKDALTSPIAYAPGTYQWTNTVKRPTKAIKAVTVSWVAISGLKKLGFPGDVAVLNLPVATADGPRGAIPFVTERGGYVPNSVEWWQPGDAAGLLIASVGRASQFPDLRDRVALLNRVLMVDPLQPDALLLLTRDLYDALVTASVRLHQISVKDPDLALRFNELYWDTYAQTTRMDIAIGMEMGGLSAPTPADYLYRLVPAMDKLAGIRPDDLENRIRLGILYRWNNDQLAAIATHEAVVKDVAGTHKTALRVRALTELAWSRIAKVAWNRLLDDPNITAAYTEAEQAFQIAERPVDKFVAAYTMAYSLFFTPRRDNQAILQRLTEARDWYLTVPGATVDSWRFLLSNDNVKGLVETDPTFQPLMAASAQSEAAEADRSHVPHP